MTTDEFLLEDSIHLSDTGNATRFVKQHSKNIRFYHPWKQWLIWNGKKWAKDEVGKITEKATATVLSIYSEAEDADGKIERRQILNHALLSESHSKIKAMLELARSRRGIPVLPMDMDQNEWILPMNNCTIDLQTFKTKQHEKSDYNTKIINIDYNPDAKCPMWIKFITQMMDNNQDLANFLKRAVGYSLTGSTREQCIFILYGVGSNGKSTFIELINQVCGEYSSRVPPESLLSKRNDNTINTDIARLVGSRLVTSMEGEEGKRLAESLIKQISGGDTITARFLYQDYFEYMPQFKLFYGTNHKPNITGTDHAIWRRIKLIPFAIKIPENEQDKDLIDKLTEELPGILNWALEGCKEWQKIGLNTPSEVTMATTEYREEMDILSEFLAICCVTGNGDFIHNKTLKKAHDIWCKLHNEKTMSHIQFSRKIEEKGFVKIKKETGRIWNNITLDPILLETLETDGLDEMTVLGVFSHNFRTRAYSKTYTKQGSNRQEPFEIVPPDNNDGLDKPSSFPTTVKNINDFKNFSNVSQSQFEVPKEIIKDGALNKLITGISNKFDKESSKHSQQSRALILFDIKQTWYGVKQPEKPLEIKNSFEAEFVRRCQKIGDTITQEIASKYVDHAFKDWNWIQF